MSLPELEWQIIYGRIAWIIVLAALALGAWPRSKRITHRSIVLLMLGVVSLTVLPNEASLAYWLGLAVLSPSGLLLGLCLLKLHAAWKGDPSHLLLPVGLTIPIVLAGTVLYLDAIGLLSLGVYSLGFGPIGAPLLALLFAGACAVAAIRGLAQPLALTLLFATMLFTLLRLPTGNLWDALLDPMLWGWSVISLFRRSWRKWKPHGEDGRNSGTQKA